MASGNLSKGHVVSLHRLSLNWCLLWSSEIHGLIDHCQMQYLCQSVQDIQYCYQDSTWPAQQSDISVQADPP